MLREYIGIMVVRKAGCGIRSTYVQRLHVYTGYIAIHISQKFNSTPNSSSKGFVDNRLEYVQHKYMQHGMSLDGSMS